MTLIGQFRRLIKEQLGENHDPAIDVLLNELGELGVDLCKPILIWRCGVEEDGESDMLIMAPTEALARKEAWSVFTEYIRGDECNDGNDCGYFQDSGDERFRGEHPEWLHYAADASELYIEEMGDHILCDDGSGLNVS